MGRKGGSATRRAQRFGAALAGLALLAVAAVASTGTHVVRRGETLGGIAKSHGSSIAELARANRITNPDLVRAGQRLAIPGAGPSGYVVQPGETLGGIARRHGTTATAIAAANGIVDLSRIYAGTRLLLTATASSAPAPPPVVNGFYRVARGETLGAIARRHGTTVEALMSANGIRDPDRIRAGTVLTIPDAAMACPVPGARFMNDWGFPRAGGRHHEGNDLYAPAGTPVLAPVAGRVEHREGPVGGLQFNLFASDGTRYLGSHLSAFGASGHVPAGAVIGAVGDSGNARGSSPHLHFEVHPGDGPAVNPYPLLLAACR